MPRSAIFIERDGALVVAGGGAEVDGRVCLAAGASSAIRRINRSGKQAIVLTHQPGVALGTLDEDTLADEHEQLRLALLDEDGRLDGIYHCPHDPRGTVERYASECTCRPPSTGLFERARDEMGIDLEQSLFIGDASDGLRAALACGVTVVLLRTERGRETESGFSTLGLSPAHVAESIDEAVEWSLQPRATAQAPLS